MENNTHKTLNKSEDNLKNEDDLKNYDDLKTEDNLKNEDDHKDEDNLKNKDNLKNEETLKIAKDHIALPYPAVAVILLIESSSITRNGYE